MKEFFARLNPTERRFVVGVLVLFFLVVNLVWVWPHFSDWGKTRIQMDKASSELIQFQQGVAKIPGLQREIEKYQKQGDVVPLDDQAVRFVRLIQNQAAQSGVIIVSMGSQRQSGGNTNNPFFVEQNETITLQSGEKQLVDFLYNLGAGNSLIRVKVLSVQPDQSHQQLTSRVTLIASYQRKAPVAAPAARPAAHSAAPAAKPPAAAPPVKPAIAVPPVRPAATNRAMPFPPPPGARPLTTIKK
ncbi:MAG TPA: hypothetical protein VG938_08260 [Verrucomicrobiae bacterium]|jgi:hypothetical protein|nr:hypothetical protein [Verrucomicrobiae bacterium]